jgi:hypothetical protein
MDPISISLLVAMGAGGAAAFVRWRNRRAEGAREPDPGAQKPSPPRKTEKSTSGNGDLRVGDVLLYMADEYWLAGELALIREGSTALRLFSAPEKGRERWLAVPREGESVFVLHVDPTLANLGWPGTEIPLKGLVLRPVERGQCAIAPSGEVEQRWEGVGRYAVFRAMETVALVVEQGAQRLALTGRTIPRRLMEKLG